jgi:F0F1-type ATP synthase delta subunit
MNGAQQFTLPPSIVSKVDVSHLVSELEAIDNQQTADAVREKVGGQGQSQVVLSEQLTDFLQQNQLELGNSLQRSELIKQLRQLKESVQVVHLTFAVAADRGSLQQLVAWFRTSVHPQTVIAVGLQPALVAGVSIRTPNRIHDLSMRSVLRKNHGLLVKELGALRGTE